MINREFFGHMEIRNLNIDQVGKPAAISAPPWKYFNHGYVWWSLRCSQTGAKVDATGWEFGPALGAAMQAGHKDIVDLPKENGAMPCGGGCQRSG
jgi:hypothetical protein